MIRRRAVTNVVGCLVVAIVWVAVEWPAGQGPLPQTQIPRTPDGKPDLNGIWQAMNTANYDLEDHGAGQSPFLLAGANGAIPPG